MFISRPVNANSRLRYCQRSIVQKHNQALLSITVNVVALCRLDVQKDYRNKRRLDACFKAQNVLFLPGYEERNLPLSLRSYMLQAGVVQ
jgi:hypothetical protein